MQSMKHRTGGYTLMELMVIVAILAIIASIAVPSYRQYVRRAQRADATAPCSCCARPRKGSSCRTAVTSRPSRT
jgi:prepilin-type N-terminal cleavage/methylation domain-containing protein